MRLGLDILFNGLQSIILVENVARGRYGGPVITDGLGFVQGFRVGHLSESPFVNTSTHNT
jgi:hypothetical protein